MVSNILEYLALVPVRTPTQAILKVVANPPHPMPWDKKYGFKLDSKSFTEQEISCSNLILLLFNLLGTLPLLKLDTGFPRREQTNL